MPKCLTLSAASYSLCFSSMQAAARVLGGDRRSAFEALSESWGGCSTTKIGCTCAITVKIILKISEGNQVTSSKQHYHLWHLSRQQQRTKSGFDLQIGFSVAPLAGDAKFLSEAWKCLVSKRDTAIRNSCAKYRSLSEEINIWTMGASIA